MYTILRTLPYGVKGLCRENEDGSHTIVLNSRYTYENNLHSYEHEIEHIRNNDFKNGVDIEKFEKE